MNRGILYVIILVAILMLPGCQYRKGKSFTCSATGDTVRYLIAASGSGKHILEKISRQIRINKTRGNEFRIVYISDSSRINGNRSILLFNSELPDLRNDMLSKGFLGTFVTREVITYLVVTQSDFEKYFTPTD
jgi:hypothetical protein